MKLFLLASLLALTACATDRQISDYACLHQISVRARALTAVRSTETIKDPVAR